MSDDKKDEKKKTTLSLGGKGTLSLGGKSPSSAGASGLVNQSFSGGRTKTVAVEVRRRRGASDQAAQDQSQIDQNDPFAGLSESEKKARIRALEAAKTGGGIKSSLPPRPVKKKDVGEETTPEDKADDKKTLRQKEMEELERIQAEEQIKADELRATQEADNEKRRKDLGYSKPSFQGRNGSLKEDDGLSVRERLKKNAQNQRKPREMPDRWAGGKITVTQALAGESEFERMPSLASQKRARQKVKTKGDSEFQAPTEKQVREIIVPETITVQELANRMAEKGANLVKSLMKMGVMATMTQSIDADTAELLVDEFGHKVKRVTEADVEIEMKGKDDKPEDMKPRAPVVTIMGHVDHGKTSLLDAFRETDVVAGEAGGITQHIGAYQVNFADDQKITFLDTPGHAAFTEMRARGANVTDIVVVVVSAADSIMPQTIEAIAHAKAADVPMIIAVNKIDLPDADPMKVKQDLLQHEVIVEDMGGDVLCVEVSAKQKMNLDKLLEAITLQAELLDIKANPDRSAEGRVVEAKMEKGRGSVATVLIQRGTLHTGEIFVSGAEWGRVRAIIDDKGNHIKQAIPGQPVEILGLNGTPLAGDDFAVVKDEAAAREIVEYRQRKQLEAKSVASSAGGFEALLAKSREEGTKTILPVVIKSDVQGSTEAIIGSLQKIAEENDEVDVQVLHSGVGGITESDVTLAGASNALIIGFNVRANAQARDLAQKNGVDIRYFSIIYNVIDDVKALLSGMLDPTQREEFIGNAEIRQVFNITKVGKVAGCMVTKGFVKRGAKVRLLRDDVVIHEGMLKTLKRVKDEVKEVKEGTECGMAFEKYDDIKEGDIIECFDIIEEARSVA
jgi:translation initiation factor IF-2